MVGDIRVKVVPDTKDLDKELKKARNFKLIPEMGKALGIGGGKRAEETNRRGFARMSVGLALIAAPLFIVGKLMKDAIGFLAEISAPIKALFKLFKLILTLLFLPLVPIFVPVLKALGKMASSLARGMGEFLTGEATIGDVITGVIEDSNIREVFASAWDSLKSTLSEIWEAIKTPVTEAFNVLKDEVLIPVMTKVFELLGKALVTEGPTLIGAFMTGIESGISGLASSIQEQIGDFWFKLMGAVLVGLAVLIIGLLAGPIAAIGAAIAAAVAFGLPLLEKFGSWLWDTLTSGIDWGWNALSGIGDWIKNKIKSFFSIFGGKPDGKATGGPVSSGTAYIVGERGPELFVPSTSGNIVPNNQMGGSSFTFSPTIHINGGGDNPREMARQIAQMAADELSRRTGSLRF